jgi:acyl carrier protein
MVDDTELKAKIKDFILAEFLPGEDPEALQDDTPLISGGILDSISTVKLVTFLEVEFDIQFEAHEMGVDYLNRLTDIVAVVRGKMSQK